MFGNNSKIVQSQLKAGKLPRIVACMHSLATAFQDVRVFVFIAMLRCRTCLASQRAKLTPRREDEASEARTNFQSKVLVAVAADPFPKPCAEVGLAHLLIPAPLLARQPSHRLGDKKAASQQQKQVRLGC